MLCRFFALALAGTLCSCASVSVTNVISLENPAPTRPPQTLYVRPFTFDEGTVRVDREGRRLEEFERSLQKEMTDGLAIHLRKYLAPTAGLPDGVAVPAGDHWVLTGRFTRINQGSRALRSTLGFGAGGTKLDCTVTVANHAMGESRPFVLIQTTGGSNAMPGAIMGVIAWPMILQGAEGLAAGVSGDAHRSAREISAALTEYLRVRGVPVAKDAPKPKIKGQLPPAMQPQPASGNLPPPAGGRPG
jgi:hypothetical protein